MPDLIRTKIQIPPLPAGLIARPDLFERLDAIRALGLLLDYMPEGITLVIITRADPPFSLSRMRARGQMIELRTADLRFASDEVALFLQNTSLTESMNAIVALNRGDPRATIDHARRAIDLIPDGLDPVYNALLVGAASYRLALAHDALGQMEEAVAVMRDVLEYLKHEDNIIGLVRAIDEIVRMYLVLDRPREAQMLCDDMMVHLKQQGYGRLPLTGLIHVAMAEISIHAGNIEEARARLKQALPLAGKSSYPGLPARVEALQARLATVQSNNETLVEPLTDRELEVLTLLGAGYSNQQIADELVITEDTVKRHNSHIYGKLGVTNRTQAVLRAQELNLISH